MLRSTPGITGAAKRCVNAVIKSNLLPALTGQYDVVRERVDTREISLGPPTAFMPPLAGFLTDWLDLARRPSDAARREKLRRRLAPLADVARDGCLLIRREQRQEPAKRQWLAAADGELPQLWHEIVERVSKGSDLKGPFGFLAGQALMLIGERTLSGVRYHVTGAGPGEGEPPAWSRTWDTVCLRPLDAALRSQLQASVDDAVECLAGDLAERLTRPRIESQPGKRLRSVAMAPLRYCGLDETDALQCCGLRAGVPPQGRFAAVSLDDRYACGLRTDGQLACWGTPPAGAAPPAGRFKTVQVAGGACALTSEGALRCWGMPAWWGDPPAGTFADFAVTLTGGHAVTVDGTLLDWEKKAISRGAVGATRVQANDCQVCVESRAGNIDCSNEKGQHAELAAPITSFAAGCAGGCGVRPDGAVACTPGSDLLPPADVTAAAPYAAIASSRDRACATSRQGRIVCWGTPWPNKWLGLRVLTAEVLERPKSGAAN